MEKKIVHVLGTEYRIEVHKVSEDDYMKKNCLAGYCGEDNKSIVVADMSEEEYFPAMNAEAQNQYFKKTLRHEIMHAFLNESGLSDNAHIPDCAWSKNEEMVDWMAIQFPKILEAFKEVGAL